jgi:hypothetical protein
MRTIEMLAVAALIALPGSLRSQDTTTPTAPAARATPPSTAAQAAQAAQLDTARLWLDSLRSEFADVDVSLDNFTTGARTVAAGERISGDLVVFRGDADVHGTVDGDVVALFGNVIAHPGSRVLGDAVAIGGRARLEGGTIDGEIRSVTGSIFAPATVTRTAPVSSTSRNVALSIGWFLFLGLLGGFLALFAREKLERIAETVRDDFTRAFMVGLLGELAIVPAIVLSVIALAITIIGLLLIPFAVVALCLATAGALALGFLAVSFLAGETFQRRGPLAAANSGRALRAVLVGLSFYLGLWLLAAVFTWAGFLGGALKLVSAALTWVAVTVGFGATILSRGGTRVPGVAPLAPPIPEDEVSWQTPTPVSGVAAARRPTPAPRPREP